MRPEHALPSDFPLLDSRYAIHGTVYRVGAVIWDGWEHTVLCVQDDYPGSVLHYPLDVFRQIGKRR